MVTTPPWKPACILEDGFMAFNPNAVENLKYVLKETNAAIVISSSHKNKYSLHQWRNIFIHRGIVAKDIRCVPQQSFSRIEEIIVYVSDITENYVIIDDDKSLNDLPVHIKDRLVLTSSLIGLDSEGAKEAVRILSGKPIKPGL